MPAPKKNVILKFFYFFTFLKFTTGKPFVNEKVSPPPSFPKKLVFFIKNTRRESYLKKRRSDCAIPIYNATKSGGATLKKNATRHFLAFAKNTTAALRRYETAKIP
jgi:hypothetical protein